MTGTHQEQILVIERDAAFAGYLTALLESAGYGVHTEGYSAAALHYATAHCPDLVILDVQLIEIDGARVCPELRNCCSFMAVPIILLTTSYQVVSSAYGADAWLIKSCEPDAILNTIERFLE